MVFDQKFARALARRTSAAREPAADQVVEPNAHVLNMERGPAETYGGIGNRLASRFPITAVSLQDTVGAPVPAPVFGGRGGL